MSAVNVNFRKAKPDELPEIHKLIASIFPDAKTEIKRTDFVFLAEIKKEKEPVGFAHYSVRDGKLLLRGIGVLKEFRGKGLGKRLLDFSLAHLPKGMPIYLKVKSSNDPAIALYVKSGFFQKKYGKCGKQGNVFVMAKLPEN